MKGERMCEKGEYMFAQEWKYMYVKGEYRYVKGECMCVREPEWIMSCTAPHMSVNLQVM